ncbi:tyrosine-protein phosphatase [Syntrophomonas erecta]
MIDIHTHILPAIDDGAADKETSLEMARMAVADGIEYLAATPHVLEGPYINSKENILTRLNKLKQDLHQAGIPLKVLPGAEYYLDPDLPEALAKGELVTINQAGKYLLVELPGAFIPPYTSQVLYELQIQGITPIIAHPERNRGFIRNHKLLRELVSRGMLTQITSGSVTGMFGKMVKRMALNYIEEGLGHLLASDAHSINGRSPRLSGAVQELKHRFSVSFVETLVYDNPYKVISGASLEPAQVVPARNRWPQALLGRLGINI